MRSHSDSYKRRNFLKGVGAAAALGLAGCSSNGGGSGGMPTIRYAGISGAELNDLVAMFQKSSYMTENVLQNVGEEYQFRFVDVQSTPVVASALGSGEADMGLLAYSSLANAIQEDVIPSGQSVVAPLTYDGPRYADTYDSKAGSNITQVSDIAGKSFGVNGVGSAIDIAARVVFTQNDMSLDNIQFREVPFGAMMPTLEGGRIDVGTFIQPFFAMNSDKLQTVFDTTDAFGNFLKIFATVRNDYLSENSGAVEALLEDLWTGMKWWKDDANSAKRVDIAHNVVGLPKPLLESLIQTERGYYHGEEGLRINPKWLQKPVDGMQEVGFLNQKLNMNEYIDNSYLPSGADKTPTVI